MRMSREEKNRIAAAYRGRMRQLNGLPAIVTGRSDGFATVCQSTERGLSRAFSWACVRRVMEEGRGRFTA